MPRLKFAFGLCLALAAPASAGPREAANALFTDPVEREAFFVMMSTDAALTAAVTEVEKSGGLQTSPLAASWRARVAVNLTYTRSALADGQKLNPPQTDYPLAPLVAPLTQNLHKQNAADLFATLNVPKYGGPAVSPPKNVAPCPAGSTALAQARQSADGNGASYTGGPCSTPTVAAATTPATARPTTSAAPVNVPTTTAPAAVTDQHTTTGAPPSPGADKDPKNSKSSSSVDWTHVAMGASIGAGIGMILGFGTPMGALAGAVIGGLIGAVMGSGLLGKLFG